MNKTHSIKRLGTKIRKYRELKDYSQEYMAQKLNINQSQYSRIEKNASDISIEKALKICETLEISISELLDEKQVSVSYFHNRDSSHASNGNIIIHNYPKDVFEKILERLDKLENI